LIGGLSNVTRHSDGVDLSRVKRVYALTAVSFEVICLLATTPPFLCLCAIR
jgi:hypothetical protein